MCVDVETYLVQAREMDDASRRLTQVVSAADSTQLSGEAFGVASAFLAESARGCIDALADTIRRTRDIVADTTGVLLAIATDFTATEDENASALEHLTEKLP